LMIIRKKVPRFFFSACVSKIYLESIAVFDSFTLLCGDS
jgi:hypothetical protein